MGQVIAHQRASDGAKRLLRRRDLHQNVGAIPLFFHHALNAAHLPLNAAEPPKIRSLDFRIDANCFKPRNRNFAPKEGFGRMFAFSGGHSSPYVSFSRLRRRLFVTTLNELKAMAALASTGLSSNPQTGYRTPAAMGIPITLYARAQNRFWRITRIVPRDSAIASATPFKSLRMSVTSPASMATS